MFMHPHAYGILPEHQTDLILLNNNKSKLYVLRNSNKYSAIDQSTKTYDDMAADALMSFDIIQQNPDGSSAVSNRTNNISESTESDTTLKQTTLTASHITKNTSHTSMSINHKLAVNIAKKNNPSYRQPTDENSHVSFTHINNIFKNMSRITKPMYLPLEDIIFKGFIIVYEDNKLIITLRAFLQHKYDMFISFTLTAASQIWSDIFKPIMNLPYKKLGADSGYCGFHVYHTTPKLLTTKQIFDFNNYPTSLFYYPSTKSLHLMYNDEGTESDYITNNTAFIIHGLQFNTISYN